MCSKSNPPAPAETGPPAPAAPPPKAAAAAPTPNEPTAAADPAAAKKAGASSLRNKRSFVPSGSVRPLVGSGLNIPV